MDIAAFATQWLMNVQTDLTRYVVFAVSVWLVLWIALARPLAGRKIRPDTPTPPPADDAADEDEDAE